MSSEENHYQETPIEEISLEGLPPLNLGALFMPPIWGPAHGIWITILYYPAWLLIDNLFYGVYENPQPLTITLAVIAGLILAGVTIVFGSSISGVCSSARSVSWQNKRAISKTTGDMGYYNGNFSCGYARCCNVL